MQISYFWILIAWFPFAIYYSFDAPRPCIFKSHFICNLANYVKNVYSDM
jgi:hypothetical protein